MAIENIQDVVSYKTAEEWTWVAPMVIATPPSRLLTEDFNGFPRIRVDVGQTGFFAGREFRAFRKLSIESAASLVVKAVVPIDVILFQLGLELSDGWVELETFAGGTEGGTYGETLTIFRRNNMASAPVISPQVVLTAGGTVTGGVMLDSFSLRTAAATAQSSSVGFSSSDERGVAPGTYYFKLTNLGVGTAVGVWRAWWEERPAGY